MNYVDKGWQSYKALLPKDASDVQIKETRQAFFGGAAILFEALINLDPGEELSDKDMQKMSDIQRELSEFGRQRRVKQIMRQAAKATQS